MQPDATPAPIGADALRVAAQAALTALENLHEIDTETECITIDVRDEIDALRAALASAAQPVAVPHAQMTEEIDLHRLQHIESAALLALGMLWMIDGLYAEIHKWKSELCFLRW